MTDHDPYVQWDAAYVLGSLTAAEREEYEEHLATCAGCRAAVAELAGLPGLLGQLSPAEAMAVDSSAAGQGASAGPFADPLVLPEPPASLMPRLPSPPVAPGDTSPLGDAGAPGDADALGGGTAGRRRWLVPLAAAAAALVIGGVGGYAASASRDAVPGGPPSSTSAGSSTRLAFTAVKDSRMTAVVDVVATSEGTELVVECQYASSVTPSRSGSSIGSGSSATGSATSLPSAPSATTGDGSYAGTRYGIWVVGRDGRQMLVKDWTARTGRIMHPSGTTSWSVSQIAAVEIRLVDTGDPVLRARLA